MFRAFKYCGTYELMTIETDFFLGVFEKFLPSGNGMHLVAGSAVEFFSVVNASLPEHQFFVLSVACKTCFSAFFRCDLCGIYYGSLVPCGRMCASRTMAGLAAGIRY